MGRVVTCTCRYGTEKGAVRALLEAHEIVLRGDIKRRMRLITISDVRIDADGLHFADDATQVTLNLPQKEAARWLDKFSRPPPSLREKLGLSEKTKALFQNTDEVTDPALETALRGMTTTTATEARMLIAIVREEAHLTAAVHVHHSLPTNSPIWVVHGKGRAAVFGESCVREGMRSRGFIDSKVAAVSQQLTASRYSKRK